jgi:hypothetical protein
MKLERIGCRKRFERAALVCLRETVITYEYVLGMNANNAEEYCERRGEQKTRVFESVAKRKHARANVTLEVVHQGLCVPKTDIYFLLVVRRRAAINILIGCLFNNNAVSRSVASRLCRPDR